MRGRILIIFSATVWVKKIPPRPAFFWHFSQTVENFKSIFCTPIIRSYLW